MSRDRLMKQATAQFKRAVSFRAKCDDPKFHTPTVAAEYLRSRRDLNETVDRIMRDHPGPWTDEEQQILRPI